MNRLKIKYQRSHFSGRLFIYNNWLHFKFKCFHSNLVLFINITSQFFTVLKIFKLNFLFHKITILLVQALLSFPFLVSNCYSTLCLVWIYFGFLCAATFELHSSKTTSWPPAVSVDTGASSTPPGIGGQTLKKRRNKLMEKLFLNCLNFNDEGKILSWIIDIELLEKIRLSPILNKIFKIIDSTTF